MCVSFLICKTYSGWLAIIHVLACNMNVKERGVSVCKRWMGGKGGALDCCCSWLAAGLVSMATCAKRLQASSLSPVSMLCTKE